MHGVGAGAAIGGAIGLCFTFIQVALDDDPGVTTAAQVEKVTKGALNQGTGHIYPTSASLEIAVFSEKWGPPNPVPTSNSNVITNPKRNPT